VLQDLCPDRRRKPDGKDKTMKNFNISISNATIDATINSSIIGATTTTGVVGEAREASGAVINEDITLHDLLTILGSVEKAGSTPTPKALRERKLEDGSVVQIEPIGTALGGDCKVYANGYAVYSNDVGTAVLWLPDCGTFTYQFGELTDKEKEYLCQRSTVDESVLGDQPWFMAVMVRGDHQVERNSMNRQFDRKGKRKELWEEDEAEAEEKKNQKWNPGYHFESPEAALIRKEMLEEQLFKLTDKQREVFLLYHRDGYNQQEIAEMLGIRQQTVQECLKSAEKKIKNFEKIFR
jgi:DNA-binding CsgD family transcriptional regulator